MTYTLDCLGESISNDEEVRRLEKSFFDKQGIEFGSIEFCNWLNKHDLRQYRQRKDIVFIGKRKI